MKIMKSTSPNTRLTRTTFGLIIALGTLSLSPLTAAPPAPEPFRDVQSSISLIGMKILDADDRPLGTVKDLAIDLENGRLVEVIIASGGFLGLGQRTVAVPPGALLYDPADGQFHLSVDRVQYAAAPSFDMSNWQDHCQSSKVAESYRYFGMTPYFAADGQDSKTGNTATEPLGFVQRSSKLVNLPVRNIHDELLGYVNTLLYNLTSGRVSHVIVLAPGFLKAKRVIPSRALRFNAAHDGLTLDITTAAFNSEPRFKWSPAGNGDFQQQAYVNTQVAANEGVNTRQKVVEGSTGSYTPLAQGASFADVDKTWRIYSAMRADSRLSDTAQNVEVGTLNGRVTLRGHVNTEAGKTIVGDIAMKAGRPENVSNLLEVRTPPVTQ
jgi:hypothetical protein